ncbi:hypothetical protein [Sciscionella sediminilitoris]|uniref:hypothetical protein n=1 Tax=Sciscionella sediminilitoris TaxID=1445613 RepID=UPI0012E1BFE5|nr:hypothetical protein [Sciscionella sp. SE31]
MLALDTPRTEMPVSTLRAMGWLTRNRPVADAPAGVRAAWRYAKAELHDRCAAEALAAGNLTEYRHETEYAQRDRAHADELAATARLGLGVRA